MLVAEQYMVIYLLSIFMCPNKDLKIVSLYCFLSFILDPMLYSIMPIYDFIMISYTVDFIIFLFVIQWVSPQLRNFMYLVYIVTLINPIFLTSLPYFLLRDDLITCYLFMVGNVIGYIVNEIIISFILLSCKTNSTKNLYLKTFIILNYIFSIIIKN